jgi:hypothetical protein
LSLGKLQSQQQIGTGDNGNERKMWEISKNELLVVVIIGKTRMIVVAEDGGIGLKVHMKKMEIQVSIDVLVL